MPKKIRQKLRKFRKKVIGEFIPVMIAIIAVGQLAFPQISMAAQPINVINQADDQIISQIIDEPDWDYTIQLPVIDNREAKHVIYITVTAYNSLPEQTDDTPCIAASGMDVCENNEENIIATNYWNLPFGTKVRFPDLFGDRIFSVEDRMNKRYYQRADIWMKEYSDAKMFGRKNTRMEILF